MRQIKGISPTALHQWESNREQFFIDRLADTRSPRDEQSPAAAVGSSFDAFVKCSLHHHIFGNDGEGVYDLQTLFEHQVSEHETRPFAWRLGKHCFERYRVCGAYDELLQELLSSTKDPKFEFTLTGEVGGVPLTGKPDLYYYRDIRVLYDWKVMGSCSKCAQSPKKLYKSCRDTWEPTITIKQTRGGGQAKPHKAYEEMDWHGHKIGSHWMEDVDKKWADQITIYGWLIGSPVGCEDTIVGIDQLACKPHPEQPTEDDPNALTNLPLIRVAQHRCRVSEGYQRSLLDRLKTMWDRIQTGYIFDDVSREESDAQIEVLEKAAAVDDDQFAAVWAECNEREYRG